MRPTKLTILGEKLGIWRKHKEKKHCPSVTIFCYIQQQINHLKANKKFGTAQNYQRALNSFSTFLAGQDIVFSELNEDMVSSYNHWLHEKKIVRNTVSFYMRVLRSVYNKAVRQQITEQRFPFQNVYTGVDRTKKRAVDENIVLLLQRMDLSNKPSLQFARDLFIFSFCTRGMAFVDMAYLRKENIVGGMICYTRRKTGKQLSISVEPCIEKIIKQYEQMTVKSEYVFPIICSTDAESPFSQYQAALRHYNKRLKQLMMLSGLRDDTVSLTSYTSRHTWATTARNHNIPISIISEGMGHTSESTTRIYLSSLKNSVIDEANKKLLAMLD